MRWRNDKSEREIEDILFAQNVKEEKGERTFTIGKDKGGLDIGFPRPSLLLCT